MASTSAPEAPAAHRIGLVYRSGRPFEHAWSQIPAGLARGLRELGFETFAVDAEPGRTTGRLAKAWALVSSGNRHGGLLAPEIRALRRATARRRASGLPPFGAVVQMGSDFGIPFPRNLVTYEDTTVLQRVDVDAIDGALGMGAIHKWVASQRKCYDTAVACCAMSSWVAESLVGDYGVDPEKVHVVWAGRNCEPRPVDRDWSRPRFLFMGLDWSRKNGDLVVRAFSRVRDRFPHARLDVAGEHPRISADGVIVHGPLDFSAPDQRANAERLLEAATCFVMPSRFEPFGIVYAEAATAGIPSIGTNVGGARDVIGDAGLLVTPGDEDMLVDSMIAMCDPDRASALGAAALENAGLFTWKACAERVVHALGRPVDRRAAETVSPG